MKVKIFKWVNVLEHCGRDMTMLNAFKKFKRRLEQCDWSNPTDITKSFRTADSITCNEKFNRIIFNVGGNKYRLICGYKFNKTKVILYVRFLGTHEEYDKVDPCTIDLFG